MTESIETLGNPGRPGYGMALGLPAGYLETATPSGDVVGANGKITPEVHVSVNTMADIVKARLAGRLMSQQLGFTSCQTTLIVTVISELARNILLYAQCGEIVVKMVANDQRIGLLISALDNGPGIENVDSILTSGYSTSGGLGLGLSGVRQITDEFAIESEKGAGTKVLAAIWLKNARDENQG